MPIELMHQLSKRVVIFSRALKLNLSKILYIYKNHEYMLAIVEK